MAALPTESTRFFRATVFTAAPLACLAAAAAAGIACGPAWSEAAAIWPWLVSLVVVGLPHGAADWAVTRQTCPVGTCRWMAAAYFAGMALVLAAFMILPVPVVALFAAVSIWHFGMAHADGQTPPIDEEPLAQGLAALARGGLVLGVPMARWPGETAAVADDVVSLIADHAASVSPGIVRVVGIVCCVAAVAAFVAEATRSWSRPAPRRRTLETAGELAVFAAVGLTTAPLFAVGLYFLCWHAWRQMLLLAPVVAGRAPADAASLVRTLVAIHRAALPLLLPTWLAVAAAWWLLSPTHSARDLALLSLVVYLVVTPSHDLLIDFVRHRAAGRAAAPRSRSSPRCAATSVFSSP